MKLLDTLSRRLRGYRPLLNQILFGLSLLGVLVVVHLYIQQGRQFDQGCLGFASLDVGPQTFDCSAVVQSQSGTLLGVSNIAWGLGFFLTVALLTLVNFRVPPRWRVWVQGARTGLLTGGLLYSGYLVYVQVGPLGALCALCLTSAAITALLFLTQLSVFVTDSTETTPSMTSRLFRRELTLYAYLVGITVVLVGADFTYFDSIEDRGASQARAETTQTSANQCQVNVEKGPLEDGGESLVGFRDITKGASDADVTVIEYFDPNCPHCKTFHSTMKKVVDAHQDDVRFVYKPFALRASSIPEIQALYIAHEEGLFTEMLEAQYARQGRTGISKEDLRAVASNIGMSPDMLIRRIEQDEYRKKILQQRKKAVDAGVDSTPTVLVNGNFVGSRTLECLNTYIERAQKGTLGTSS